MFTLNISKQNNFIIKSITFLLVVLFVFISIVPTQFVNAQLSPQERAKLESELAELEKDIKAQEAVLAGQKNKSASLQRDIALLQAKITAAKSKIQQKDLQIKKIGSEIKNKNQTISELNNDIESGKKSLSQLIKKTNEMDYVTFTHAVLSSESISDFYGDINTYSSLKKSVQNSVNEIRGVKVKTEVVKKELEVKQVQEIDAKKVIEAEKSKVEVSEKDQKQLLGISKNQEEEYAKVLAQRQAEAAKIRSALIQFQGSGVQSRSISFGEAYDYAKAAGQKTGVRPAFIMAIMQQETGFGNNVGGCNLREKPESPFGNVYKYDGIYIKSGNPSKKNMIPSNFDNFVKITSSLGMDWKTTPISCALVRADGSIYGFGGAMGYTQFIPNTWMLVEARVRQYLGVNAASPWNPAHAVMATAVHMQDLGAAAQTYSTEHNAACRYYGACSTYATSVLNKATSIQKQVDVLESF